MKKPLGWLVYLLLLAFAAGLLWALAAFAWRHLAEDKAGVGVIGFGVPTFLAGMAVYGLSKDDRPLRLVLGWTSALVGLGCGVCLLVCVASMMISPERFDGSSPEVLSALGFGVVMFVAGGLGIAWLCERRRTEAEAPPTQTGR